MKFFLDTADIAAVRARNEYWPLAGFTTNPNILAGYPGDPKELFPLYRDYINETSQTLFVQVTGTERDPMLAQAEKLKAYFGEHLCVKLPADRDGYSACRLASREGIDCCITAVHSVLQAVMAAEAGAKWAAPYLTHIDNNGTDGIECVQDMLRAVSGSGTRILAASFRTKRQAERLAVIGCDAVTVTPEFLDALTTHPSTDESLAMFRRVWRERFGDTEVSDIL